MLKFIPIAGWFIVAGTLSVLVLSKPSEAQGASPVASSSAKLTGVAAWNALVGNTIVATSRGGDYTEFFTPDGAVKHVDEEGRSAGQWSVQGQKVCFDFPDEDDRSCVDIEIENGKGAFIDETGAKDMFDVLPGNAKNL